MVRVWIVFALVLTVALAMREAPSSPFTAKIVPTASGNATEMKCILCGIVVNELEGLLSENMTETDIEKVLIGSVCNVVGKTHYNDCLALMDDIPKFIAHLDNKDSVSVVCVEENYCKVPLTYPSDPQPVPTYVINLDDLPETRWKEVCNNATYGKYVQGIITTLKDLFPSNDSIWLEAAGVTLNAFYYPLDIAAEIRGCASQLGVPSGWLTVLNTIYELVDACTSIVSQTSDGKIYHVRNMDFWDGIWLSDILKNITVTAEFTSFGKTKFYVTTFAGYMGALSGMRPNAFSISMNTRRFSLLNITTYVKEIISELHGRNRSFTSTLVRKTLEDQTDFPSAVKALSSTPLMTEVYYIVGGLSANEGVVITRNPDNATDTWRLNSTSWYEVQTNYDHWKRAPWFDDRIIPATEAMNAMGQANVSLDNLFGVLSVKPVLNLQSTFTMLACPADGTYTSLTRYCPYPCAE